MSTAAAEKPPADQFAYWQARLRGEEPDHTRGRAEAGYWRVRHRDGRVVPVRLWREPETDRLCMIYDLKQPEYVEDEETFCERIFGYALKNPVSSSSYKHYEKHGRWPEDIADVSDKVEEKVGTNAPPEVIANETVEELYGEAQRWLRELGGEITTQADADKAINYHLRFLELRKESEDTRTREKAPLLKATREIDGKWMPIVKKAADYAAWAKALPTRFFKAEQQRKLEAAAAKAKQGEAVTEADLNKVKAGTRGRSVSLRTVKKLQVTSETELIAHYSKDERFWGDPDVQRTLRRLAEGDLKTGQDVPGAALKTEQVP